MAGTAAIVPDNIRLAVKKAAVTRRSSMRIRASPSSGASVIQEACQAEDKALVKAPSTHHRSITVMVRSASYDLVRCSASDGLDFNNKPHEADAHYSRREQFEDGRNVTFAPLNPKVEQGTA